MKLRNLFLASLAAMAMVSCSNEIEGVDNGINNVEKNAKLQFSIGLPSIAKSRATEDEIAKGTADESAINTVNIKVVYNEAITPDLFHYVFPGDFTKDGENNVYTLNPDKLMEVAPSTGATLYVTINGDENVTLNGTTTATYDAEASISTGLAKAGNFLMSGKSDPTPIVKNSSENRATVEVDRVAARIDETSENKVAEFTFTTDYRNLDGTVYKTEETSMTAEIIDYALCNLNQNTNIFDLPAFAEASYFQEFVLNSGKTYADFINKAFGTTSTYTLENNSTTYKTSVTYKVQYKYDGTTATGDFFTYAKDINGEKTTVLYKDFESLDNDNSNKFSLGFGLNADSDYNAFIEAGVTKYEEGIAYYTKPITTGLSTEKIVRNNCYLLNVNTIKGLGKAVVDPKEPGDPTLLSLTVSVKNWTINPNSFDLQ